MKGNDLMRRITLALAAMSTVAVVTVAGCASQGAQPLGNVKLSAAEAVQQSAQKAEEVTSYTVDAVAGFTDPQQGTGKVQGRMVYQSKPELAADLTLDTIDFGGQSVPGGARAVLQGDTVYVKVEALNKLLGATKPWIKVSLADLDKGGASEARQYLDQVQQFDLAAAVKMVTTSKDVSAVGTETVGGVETTHYSGTFPVEEALAQLPAEKREGVQSRLAEAKNAKFDLWADAEGLPRKITLNGDAEGGTFTVTMTFKGFNEPVEISAPPADQVGDLPQRAGG
jgi:hypothetical protein